MDDAPTADPPPTQRPEPEVLFDLTSTKASPPKSPTFNLEGAIAGIVVGLLLLTALMIAAIIFWFRRERTRQNEMRTSQKEFIPVDAPYAVIPNTDVVPHPTWYPPPQPVLILPSRNTPECKLILFFRQF